MRHFSMYRVLNGRTENRSKTREIFLLISLIDRSCEGNVGGKPVRVWRAGGGERVRAWRAGCGERVRARRAGGGERVHAWEWCLRASCLTRCESYHMVRAIPQGASHPTWCKPSHKMQFASFQLLELINLSPVPRSITGSLSGEIVPLRPQPAPRGQ